MQRASSIVRARRRGRTSASSARRIAADPMPTNVAPMLAVLAADVPSDPHNYAFEYKWDGVRAIAYYDGKRLQLRSRNDLIITQRYPELHSLGEAIGKTPVVL